MTAKAAYQFLKPSLEGFSQEEKEELCRLISGEPKPKKKTRRKKIDPVPSEEWYRKRLLDGFFKSRTN